MERRFFLKTLGGLAGLSALAPIPSLAAPEHLPSELQADVVIVGGSMGGTAAALAAARNGARVILTETTDWIGGQLTAQAVPPDEHPWIEQFGATASYRTYREAVRHHYRRWYALTGAAHDDPHLNPGRCGVSRLCHEPRAALAVLEGMLAPHVSAGRVTILRHHTPAAAQTTGDRVDAIRVRDTRDGSERTLTALFFVDATELGDLLPLTGTEYVTGAEAQSDTGELHAPPEAQPLNMQALTWCFAMDHVPGEDHTIDKPDDYDFWAAHVPSVEPPWPGRLLSWSYSNPRTLEPRELAFDPRPGHPTEAFNLWLYRRLLDPANFREGTIPSGITLVNWPQNDYFLGNIIEVPPEEAAENRRQARQLSHSLLYWMQTEAPRPDGGTGWPGLRLRGDLTGTAHGLAKKPYVREARRIKAVFTVKEQHVGTEARMEATGLQREEVTAARFDDSVGVGSYRIDLHPSTQGDNYIDISSLPFEIPLGALLPQRMTNLLPACKNIGTTHITNGCYRLHPVEWNIGESVGALVAFCLQEDATPHQVRADESILGDFQRALQQQGVELRWPRPMRAPQ